MTRRAWKPIPSCPGYEASDDGLIRCTTSARANLIGQVADRGGYLQFRHRQDGVVSWKAVHVAVAEAFNGPRPDGQQVRHFNGDQLDNRPFNLIYGTPAQNVQDQLRHGTHAQAAKSECSAGHEFDEANTYRRPDGGRNCRACLRDASRRYQQRRRAEALSLRSSRGAR